MSRRARASACDLLVRAAACAVLGACGRDRGPGPDGGFEAPGPTAGDLATDDRIAWLLAPCSKPEPFVEDTGDPVAILVSKLGTGQLDPMRLAKTELSAMGETAVPELRRFYQRYAGDPASAPKLLNAIGVVAAMEGDAGRDILLDALSHPQDTVRLEALRGLGVHAHPADYDRLKALVPISTNEALVEIGTGLVRADRERAEADLCEWLAGPREEPGVWLGATDHLVDTDRPRTLACFREVLPSVQGPLRAWLAAALARAGDEEALALLREDLRSDSLERRTLAVRVLDAAGLVSEIAPRLTEDRDEALRGLVAGAIARRPPSAETNAWLARGTLDRAKTVRLVCLAALAERGDPEARDLGLTMLEGGRSDLEYGIQVLRGAWEADPEFAQRTFDLLERMRAGDVRGASVDAWTVDRAIAQLPLVDAARALYDRACTTRGAIDGIPAHRWYLAQAGNTGDVGRAWLRERWGEEEHPPWRVDIVAASSYEKDEASREFLLRVVEDERTTPLELLHAANLLVHHGPTALVAPRLKRVVLRVDDPAVRPALNCLLRQWYAREP